MKNYSDLPDTKLQLDIELELIGRPDFILDIGSQRGESKSGNQTYYLDLLTPFDVSINLYNKVYTTEYETAVVIRRLLVDNIDIIPKYDYLADYINDHDNHNPTSYLGFNGKWTLTVDRPFYQWLHQAQNQGWLIG